MLKDTFPFPFHTVHWTFTYITFSVRPPEALCTYVCVTQAVPTAARTHNPDKKQLIVTETVGKHCLFPADYVHRQET